MAEITPKTLAPLEKSVTGLSGFDEITNGGLPKGRPTLVCGAAGSGKPCLQWNFSCAALFNTMSRRVMEAQIESLRAELTAEEEEVQKILEKDRLREARLQEERRAMAASRKADGEKGGHK